MSLLDNAREQINEIDKKMVDLFEKRMQAVENVVQYKQEHKMPILDISREQYVMEHNATYLKNNKYKDSYMMFMQQVMTISKVYQKTIINKKRIGYQGTQGAFSHIASEHIFPDYSKASYTSFGDVFKAVEEGEVAYGVIPFENSYTGEIGEVLDLLMQYDVFVNKTYDLKINQNLLGVKGATLADIKQVYSKDQAIYQSRQFLEGRGYEVIPYPNTALAAEYVANEKDKTKAAIAAKENAALYDLDVLAENINTSNENTTRFIVICKEKPMRGNQFNIAFTVHHTAGALAEAMNVIAKYGFNMQNIKSRSIKNRPWEYYFYVELDGDVNQAKERNMFDELHEVCEKVKILGAYQKESRDE